MSFHSKTWSQISLWMKLVCVCVGVYIRWIKMSPKLPLVLFLCLLQKMVGWVAFEVSICFMLKFKPFKMWWPTSLFIVLRFLLCVWKVIPYRKGFTCNMRQKQSWNVICLVSFKNQNCMKIVLIVSCLERLTCLFLFIMVEFKSYYTAPT